MTRAFYMLSWLSAQSQAQKRSNGLYVVTWQKPDNLQRWPLSNHGHNVCRWYILLTYPSLHFGLHRPVFFLLPFDLLIYRPLKCKSKKNVCHFSNAQCQISLLEVANFSILTAIVHHVPHKNTPRHIWSVDLACLKRHMTEEGELPFFQDPGPSRYDYINRVLLLTLTE